MNWIKKTKLLFKLTLFLFKASGVDINLLHFTLCEVLLRKSIYWQLLLRCSYVQKTTPSLSTGPASHWNILTPSCPLSFCSLGFLLFLLLLLVQAKGMGELRSMSLQEEDEKGNRSFWKSEEVTFQVIKFKSCLCRSLTWWLREVLWSFAPSLPSL